MRMHRNILRKITLEGLDPNIEYIEDSLGNLVPKVKESIPITDDDASLNSDSIPVAEDEKEASEILVEKPKRKPPPPRKKKADPTTVQE